MFWATSVKRWSNPGKKKTKIVLILNLNTQKQHNAVLVQPHYTITHLVGGNRTVQFMTSAPTKSYVFSFKVARTNT